MILRKHKKQYLKLVLTALFSTSAVSLFSQVLYPHQPLNQPFIMAEEQFRQQHYAMAAQSANAYLHQSFDENIKTEQRADAEKAKFIDIISGLRVNEAGIAARADAAMQTIIGDAYRQRICFALAQYYFLHNQLPAAIPYYEKTGLDNLTNAEIADLKFELAYCYFTNKQFDKAEQLFQSIKELKEGKYYNPGNYYYGLLAYNNNKFKEALKSFERIRNEKEYKGIVAYYIAEIYYFMGNREQSLQEAKNIIAGKEKSFYDKDVHKLAAQCLFEDEKYADAKPYFEYYYDHADQIRKEDLYKIAYCYYRLSDWKEAIEKFKLLSNTKDSLGQSSMYLLGDCYLKMGNRHNARNAFGFCADLNYNLAQQEAAMILYSRISYETGYNDEAVRQLLILLKTFPNSQYKDEANTLLSSLLIRTNKFADALKYLDMVNKKDKEYWQIYQKAAYGFAVQQFRAGDLNSAYTYFGNAAKQTADPVFESASKFWLGELAYRLNRNNEAIAYSQDFINNKADKNAVAVISPQATVQHAYLNMGFAAMEEQNFSAAQSYFYKAKEIKGDDNYSATLANIREADAVFMQQNYIKAIALYDKIANTDTENADYAKYQKSIILGLQGKNNEKVAVLKSLIERKEQSVYNVTARYEMAVTYIELDKYAQALPLLKYITDTSNDKGAAPKAWMKIGFVRQQQNETDQAIEAYRHIVAEYPAADERMAAMDALKSLFIQNNQPESYAKLLRENKLPSSDSSAIDSAYYAAAEAQFALGKYDQSIKAFSNYLSTYPNGIFAIKAYYYRGESYYQLKKNTEAIADMNMVLTAPWNDFSENSALHAAAIAYEQKDYTAAYNYYLKLKAHAGNNEQLLHTALTGLVKTAYNTEKYAESSSYADTLLTESGLQADVITGALLYKAKSLQHFSKLDTAINIFRQLADNKDGEIAAESRYHISEIYFAQDSLSAAENAANETIRLSSGYDYWIVKSYLLLGDIFTKQGDYFNAKATLNSIVKLAKNPELKSEANKKLAEVKKLEKKQSKLKED